MFLTKKQLEGDQGREEQRLWEAHCSSRITRSRRVGKAATGDDGGRCCREGLAQTAGIETESDLGHIAFALTFFP